MYDDSDLREQVLTLFGPGPDPVTADEAMSRVTGPHRVPRPKWSRRTGRMPRGTAAVLWAGGVVVLIVAVVLGFGAGLGSNVGSKPSTGSGLTWHQIMYGGLRLSVPANWPVRSVNSSDCGATSSPYFVPSSVVLVTAVKGTAVACVPFYVTGSTIAPMYSGIVIDTDPDAQLGNFNLGQCREVNGLKLCPGTNEGGVQDFAVYIAGESTPVFIEIGLAGSGQIERTILDSMRPSGTATPPTTSTTAAKTSTTTTTTKQTLRPLNLAALPVPSGYTCSASLYALSPANEAAGECVPYAYLVGGTASDPDDDTACPAGSFMTMGPVECDNESGIVTAVPPGPNTCATPGGPCPSSKLPLSSQASVISWSAIEFPTAKCPAGYYFGETNGIATCVPYGYLPGGTSTRPDNDTACPAGSGLKVVKLTGTLCTQYAEPYDIVAPIPREP
jgi:hypothetical protein